MLVLGISSSLFNFIFTIFGEAYRARPDKVMEAHDITPKFLGSLRIARKRIERTSTGSDHGAPVAHNAPWSPGRSPLEGPRRP